MDKFVGKMFVYKYDKKKAICFVYKIELLSEEDEDYVIHVLHGNKDRTIKVTKKAWISNFKQTDCNK